MRLLIKMATRSRPGRVMEVMDKYISMASGKVPIEVIISADVDDLSMNNPKVKGYFSSLSNCRLFLGYNKSKIEACNADISQARPWDIVLLASDDMVPVKKGYDLRIVKEMSHYFPDTDGCLWFNEGAGKQLVSMLSIIGRKYYDRFGYLYHPSYKSFFCDNEYTDIALKLGRIVYIDEVIIKHMHPAWQRGVPTDKLYDQNQKFWSIDKENYIIRKQNNFYS